MSKKDPILDWPRVGVIALVINGLYAAFVAAAYHEAKEEREHVHWTDRNRWEK